MNENNVADQFTIAQFFRPANYETHSNDTNYSNQYIMVVEILAAITSIFHWCTLQTLSVHEHEMFAAVCDSLGWITPFCHEHL